MMNIDIHSHFIPDRFIEEVKKEPERYGIRFEQKGGMGYFLHKEGLTYPLLRSFFDVDEKLQHMDRMRLDMSVLSAPPTMFYYWSDFTTAKHVCRVFNDSVAELVTADPNHFQAMGIVPLHHIDEAILELKRCHHELGIRAIELGSHFEGIPFSDERFLPFFEAVAELDMLVFFHPYFLGHKKGLEPYYLTNLLGNPIDTTVAIAHIVLGGLLHKLPNLKLYFAHAGGFMPFQLGRLEHGYNVRTETKINLEESPAKHVRKLFFDTIIYHPKALQFLIDIQGEDNILLGTDFPFDMEEADPVSFISSVPGLRPEQRKKILGYNAARLLKI